MTRRGSVLLEVVVAIAVVVVTGLAGLAVVREASARADRLEARRVGLDVARAALLRLSVEGVDAQAITGPAAAVLGGAFDAGDDESEGEGGLASPWSGLFIEATSTPSQFDGLSVVTVSVEQSGVPIAKLTTLTPASRDRSEAPLSSARGAR